MQRQADLMFCEHM